MAQALDTGDCLKRRVSAFDLNRVRKMERVKGIEPSSQPWEGHILPLNHTRFEITLQPQISPHIAG